MFDASVYRGIIVILSPSGVTTRGSDWANPGAPSSRGALSYNVEPKAWCKSVFTVLLITI